MKADMPWASTDASSRDRGREPTYYGKDTGCSLHPSCLACPREVCRYDDETRKGGRPSTGVTAVREGPSR